MHVGFGGKGGARLSGRVPDSFDHALEFPCT